MIFRDNQKQLLLVSTSATQTEGIGFYVSENGAGTATINQFTFDEGTTGLNGPLTINTPAAIETGLIGSDLTFYSGLTDGSNGSGGLNNTFTGTGTSYDLAWGQYNSTTDTYTASFQIFGPSGATTNASNPDAAAMSGAIQLINLTGVTSATAAPAWFFRNAGANSSGTPLYGSAIAELNATTHSDYIQFQAYSVTGSLIAPSFQIQPNLTAYASGATDLITQQPQSPTHTASPNSLQFVPNVGSGSGYSFAWNDTVTDSNGTHDQVEFAIYHPSTSTLVSQSEFQIADGNAQNIELATATIDGVNVEILVYGDNSGTHVVEFNASGTELASLFDPSTSTFGRLVSLGDGRIELAYDNVLDASGTTQNVTDIYDLRTTGLSVNNSTGTFTSDQYFAGTQFNDAVVGANNVNNTYYYVGENTTVGSGPTDSFTGGTGTSWNVAILPDAPSNYTITTNGGVTTLVNTGDSAHAGTLQLTDIQAIAFAPTVDPSGNSGTLTATGDELYILGPLPNGGSEPITIDAGSSLVLATPEAGTVTFAGASGDMILTNPASFTYAISGITQGDAKLTIWIVDLLT